MHFGFYITKTAAVQWSIGKYSDADLLLLDDILDRSRGVYWVGSVKTLKECFELRSYGPRFAFRTKVATIIRWAHDAGFARMHAEENGSMRFMGSLRCKKV